MSTITRTVRNFWKIGFKVPRPTAPVARPLLTVCDRTSCTR